MIVYESEHVVKEFHLDTFGHVNNAAYLTIFEESRWEFITQNGYGMKEVHHHKKAPIILEVNLKFRKELKLREKIKITIEILKYGRKIGVLEQKIYNEKNELCTVGTFSMGFFDLTTRSLIEATPEWLSAIKIQPESN